MKFRKLLKQKIINFIYDYIYIPVLFNTIYFRDLKRIKKAYGNYECLSRTNQKKFTLNFVGEQKNGTGGYVSEIVKSILDLRLNPKKILLDGDDKSIVDQFKRRFNFEKSEVVTAGKDGNFDYDWNFEHDYPADISKDFDLIISQAMFEHLINPYKHFQDLSALLRGGGLFGYSHCYARIH